MNAKPSNPFCPGHRNRLYRHGCPTHSSRDWSSHLIGIRAEVSRFLFTPLAEPFKPGIATLIRFLTLEAPEHPCKPLRATVRRLEVHATDHHRTAGRQPPVPVPVHRQITQLVARVAWSLRHRRQDFDLGEEYMGGTVMQALDLLSPVPKHIDGYIPRRLFKPLAEAGRVLWPKFRDLLMSLAGAVNDFVARFPNQRSKTPPNLKRLRQKEQAAADSTPLVQRLRHAEEAHQRCHVQTAAPSHQARHGPAVGSVSTEQSDRVVVIHQTREGEPVSHELIEAHRAAGRTVHIRHDS